MSEKISGNGSDILKTLLTAVENEDVPALFNWSMAHGDTALIAHDYPQEGQQTLVRPSDLLVYFGSDRVQIGFETEVASNSPMTTQEIGRLSVINIIDHTDAFRRLDTQ